MSYTYEYPRPAVTVDAILLVTETTDIKILLIQRKHDPFAGKWALPGGFVNENESPDDAVLRELKEETQIDGLSFTQFHTFGQAGRDPRGHVVSVVYYGYAPSTQIHAKADDDAGDLAWFSVNQLPELAFDHADIIRMAMNDLSSKK